MAFCCPQCGGGCWGTGFGDVGCCQACTQMGVAGMPPPRGVGGCGFRWQRSRANDAALGIEPVGLDATLGGIVGDGPCVVDERDYGIFSRASGGGCGTTDKPGCVMYSDGTCSCARGAGVGGACGPCAQKINALSADIDDLAFLDARQRAVHQAYPDRDIGGWDVWTSDARVEPIWVKIMAANGYDAAHAEKIRAYAAGQPKTDPTATLQPMSIWPMVAVGVVAIGIFAATLAINKSNR